MHMHTWRDCLLLTHHEGRSTLQWYPGLIDGLMLIICNTSIISYAAYDISHFFFILKQTSSFESLFLSLYRAICCFRWSGDTYLSESSVVVNQVLCSLTPMHHLLLSIAPRSHPFTILFCKFWPQAAQTCITLSTYILLKSSFQTAVLATCIWSQIPIVHFTWTKKTPKIYATCKCHFRVQAYWLPVTRTQKMAKMILILGWKTTT